MYHCKAAASTSSEKNTEAGPAAKSRAECAHTRAAERCGRSPLSSKQLLYPYSSSDYFHCNVGPPRPPHSDSVNFCSHVDRASQISKNMLDNPQSVLPAPVLMVAVVVSYVD